MQVSFSNDEEVENRYTPSEESREHLERIFVVQHPVNGSTHRSVDHPNGSHHFSNRGYVNSSHSSKPRLNPPIEATAPSMVWKISPLDIVMHLSLHCHLGVFIYHYIVI